MYELKIPKSRVACLIGKKGETKRLIERSTKTRMKVYTEGDVEINGDGFSAYICEKIVRAVGRGFNPNIAIDLLKEDFGLEILNIKDYTGNSKKKFYRIKSRLIGKEGKSRKVIEKIRGCHVCVFGKTVSIIGKFDKLNV